MGIKYLDTQCGFKAFSNDVARQIFKQVKTDGYAFDIEVLKIAKKMNFEVIEAPVIWSNKLGSKVNLLNDSISIFKDLLRMNMKKSA